MMTITQCNLVALLISHFCITLSVMHRTPDQAMWASLFGFMVSCVAIGIAYQVHKYTGK